MAKPVGEAAVSKGAAAPALVRGKLADRGALEEQALVLAVRARTRLAVPEPAEGTPGTPALMRGKAGSPRAAWAGTRLSSPSLRSEMSSNH